MSELRIPYRSQSHALNEFLDNVSNDIERLYAKYNEIDADAKMLIRAAKVQEMAIAGKIAELIDLLNTPKKLTDDIWQHYIGITRFTPLDSGIIMPRFNAASVTEKKTVSCVTVTTRTGEEILPETVKVEVSPAADGSAIKDNNPYNALTGSRPWWREIQFAAGYKGEATYTVYLPTNVLERAEFNQIRIVPFPLYLVTVEGIEYRYNSKWHGIDAPGLPSDGAILIATEPIKADAVRLKLTQKDPFWLDSEQKYNIGLASLAIERVTVPGEPAKFTTEMELAGEGPWKIIGLDVEMLSPGNVSVEISDLSGTVSSSLLPITVSSNKIKLTLTLQSQDENVRPLVSGVTLKYQEKAVIC